MVPAFKEHDLWGVNACRLYLKVTMLSEIIDETNMTLHRKLGNVW